MIYKYFILVLIYPFIYLFCFIHENVEGPLGGAVLFFFGNEMKTLQLKYLFGRIFFLLRRYPIYCN